MPSTPIPTFIPSAQPADQDLPSGSVASTNQSLLESAETVSDPYVMWRGEEDKTSVPSSVE